MVCDRTVYRRSPAFAAAWRRVLEEERRRRLRRRMERARLRPAGGSA